MGRIRGFLILTLTAGFVLFFQNCAKAPDTLLLDGDAAIAQPDSGGSLKVTSNVNLIDSGSGRQQGLKANRFVNPIEIHFGPIAHDFSYVFPYNLDLATGEITALSSGAHVGDLTASEADQLDRILGDAVVASHRDFMEDGIMCASVMVEGYAGLHTDQGSVILGHGTSSCDVADLLQDDGGGNEAGLKQFLADLTARL